MQWETFALEPSLKVRSISNPYIYPSLLEAEVNRLWENKKKQFPKLFNGRIFNVTTITSNNITGYWTEYKYVLAQTVKPELYTQLLIRSLAVIGLIQCSQGIILGKRSTNAVYLPGYWQSPPAGTVESRQNTDDVNLLDQLYAEAQEELGLQQNDFFNPTILSATEHSDTHIIDIGIKLETQLSYQVILQKWKENANPEYQALICINNQLDIPDRTLPTTLYLLKSMGE
ncbi:NUDIX hydrolase [Commensalibacter oyaizuii]|uniref:Nudix hydrolase domain-containing protein n=1 Tax=Commensalibacter oyaizuii TaxID=3043873 RepID=A0ABT6PZD6_9PROT|nr:hypothetical protein [Commensalibacter sp. TBRC 16381]MDI2090218.1 hypothetical protein [Commensalibacter sp. TBRC 16381]